MALGRATTKEVEAGAQADSRAVGLQAACESAVAESQRWKRREMLVRQQIAGLTERAERLDRDVQSLDAERDVLARERDALKAALTKAVRRSGYAVLPYKGPNGTWQRPIVLECTADGVKLQRQGRTFTALELSPLIHRRASPFVQAIAKELLHIRSADTPDGAPAVPYLVFLVRPDGIRSYYEARTCLEPLGIAFGYELIERNRVVDIPDFDDLTTWDGTIPLEMPLEPAPRPKSNVASLSSADKTGGGPRAVPPGGPRGDLASAGAWPERSMRRGRPTGSDSSNPDDSSPEDFVWPGRGRHAADDDASGSGTASLHRSGDPLGTGSGTGGDGGLNPLPELEPAGDSGATQSTSLTSEGPSGGQMQGLTPGEVGMGSSARGGEEGRRAEGGGRRIGSSARGSEGATAAGAREGDPFQAPGVVQNGADVPSVGDTGSTAAGPRLGSGEISPASAGSNSNFGMPSSSSTNAANAGSNSSFGMPSSSSTNAANAGSSTAGMPLGSTWSTSSSASGSSFSLGQDAASRSAASDEMNFPPRPRTTPPMGSIEVPFEIVVVCRRCDVLLHPGGYRLTVQAMREQGGGNDGLLAREIRAMVCRRVLVDPMIRPKPAIRFLVESYGADAFWTARRQLLFTVPDWPMSLQVSSSQEPRVFSRETW